MQTLRASAILFLFLMLTLACIPVQWVAVKLHLPMRRSFPHRYHRWVCALMGLRIVISGTPMQGGVLMAANHTGWLDIPLLSAVAPVSFAAKSEVNRWPFFGLLARLQRTIFIHRGERSKAIADRDRIRKRLLDGDTLVIFPEGTSSDGNRVLPFKSSLLSAAELTLGEDEAHHIVHVPVQPVSIAFVRLHGMPMGRENRPFFAWYGDMELVPHLWEAFRAGPIDVEIVFHPSLTIASAGGRKQLALAAEHAVRSGVIAALAGVHSDPVPPDDGLAELEDDDADEDEDEASGGEMAEDSRKAPGGTVPVA
jgi:1-acyl-sn-glycerol-3-phosphate acyltransferase